MDKTQKMIELLGNLRREMNGAVADSMYYSGKCYGLNYGVSIPTIRSIARQEPKDMALAKYLIEQQVRELQLAALHLIPVEELTLDDSIGLEHHITNSEIAEEASFAVFCRCDHINPLCDRWLSSGDECLTYCALLAAARNPLADKAVAAAYLSDIISEHTSRIVLQGAIALLTSLANTSDKGSVRHILAALTDCPATHKIREEVEWLLEY